MKRAYARPETEAEAEARAINAEPWVPMVGMVKRQCPQCRYFFATPIGNPARRCLDCTSLGTGFTRVAMPHSA
jgi:hypothetical protein